MTSRAKKTEWGGMCCESERDKTACASWFRPLVPEAWGLPLAAQVLTDIDTDEEKAIRAVFKTERGLRLAMRRMNKRNWTLTFTQPTEAELRSMHLTPDGAVKLFGVSQ